MTYTQIEWAASHDWYLKEVLFGVIVKDGLEVLTFTNIKELKAWAGD